MTTRLNAQPERALIMLEQWGRPIRRGRHIGRTLYLMVEDEPTDRDLLVGVMDSPELAAVVVSAVNAWQAEHG